MNDITMDSLLNSVREFERLVPRINPSHIRVHPSRYQEIFEYLQPGVAMPDNFHLWPFAGIQIIKDTFVPAYRTERRRRILTKKQRSRWHVRKYRNVEVPILGWLIDTDKISTIEWRKV